MLELNQSEKSLSIKGLCNTIGGQLVAGSFLMATKMYCQDLMKLESFVSRIVGNNLGLLAGLNAQKKKIFDGKDWIEILQYKKKN